MKIISLSGAATTTRTTMLQRSIEAAAAILPGVTQLVPRTVAAAPPPRASSFGGADPRAMFEALVQSFDRDGDGKLSLDEVNALNQGGQISRSFGRIDSNADGKISGDEIAALAPWASGDPGGGRGAPVRPLFDKLTDHLNSNSDMAISVETRTAARDADLARGMGRFATPQAVSQAGQAGAGDPATLMESMVLALATAAPGETEAAPASGVLQISTVR